MKKLDIAAIVYSIFFAIISVSLIVSTYIARQTYAHDNVTVTTAARVAILCLVAIHILFICTVNSRAAQITVTCTMLPILVMIYQTLGYIIVPQTAYILAYVIIVRKTWNRKIRKIAAGITLTAFVGVLTFILVSCAIIYDPSVRYTEQEYISPDGEYTVTVSVGTSKESNVIQNSISYRYNHVELYYIYDIIPHEIGISSVHDFDDTSLKWVGNRQFIVSGKTYTISRMN